MTPSIYKWCKQFISDIDTAGRESLVSLTCLELQEIENIFSLLILGSFVGLPSPPTLLYVELLPFMEQELATMNRKAENSEDMLAEIVGTLGID